MKIHTNEFGHMTNMAAMPIYGKNLKKSSTPEAIDQWLETWCVALSMRLLPRLFKLGPWVDLDLFYMKVKFGYIGFCMEESEIYLFFGNYCSLRSQSCLKHSAKWVYEVEWVSKSRSFFDLVKGHPDFKVKCLTLACILRWVIRFRAMGPLV